MSKMPRRRKEIELSDAESQDEGFGSSKNTTDSQYKPRRPPRRAQFKSETNNQAMRGFYENPVLLVLLLGLVVISILSIKVWTLRSDHQSLAEKVNQLETELNEMIDVAKSCTTSVGRIRIIEERIKDSNIGDKCLLVQNTAFVFVLVLFAICGAHCYYIKKKIR